MNNSDIVLTEDQMNVLSKGLKFAATPRSLNMIEIITNTEQSLYGAPELTKQLAISEINTLYI